MRTRLTLAIIVASCAAAAPAPTALAGSVRLRVVQSAAVRPVETVNGIPFLLAVYGSQVRLEGSVLGDDGRPAPSKLVVLQYSEWPFAAWRDASYVRTDARGRFHVVSGGFFGASAFAPRRDAYMQAVVSPVNDGIEPATSNAVGLFVVPDIVITSPLSVTSSSYTLHGRVRVPATAKGTLALASGSLAVSGPTRLTLRGSESFSFTVRASASGVYPLALRYTQTGGPAARPSQLVVRVAITVPQRRVIPRQSASPGRVQSVGKPRPIGTPPQ